MGLGSIAKSVGSLWGGMATGTGLLGAGAISGALGGLGAGAPPEHQMAGLDEQSQKMIQDQRNRANLSPEEIASQRMQGVDQGDELNRANGDLAMRKLGAAGESGDNESLRQALSNRSRRSYAQDLTQIRRQTENQAGDIKARYAAQAYDNLANQQKIMSGIARKKQSEKEANAKARMEVINMAIGTGMSVGGAILGANAGKGKPQGGGSMQTTQMGDAGTGGSDYSNYA